MKSLTHDSVWFHVEVTNEWQIDNWSIEEAWLVDMSMQIIQLL